MFIKEEFVKELSVLYMVRYYLGIILILQIFCYHVSNVLGNQRTGSFGVSYICIFVIFAATATESQSASVCFGPAWPPNCDTTAVCSGHHFTDTAGPAE